MLQVNPAVPFGLLSVWFFLTPAFALDVPPADKGRKRVTFLFQETSKLIGPAVVEVLCNERSTILGTVVDDEGLIVTKDSELRGTLQVRFYDGTVADAQRMARDIPTDLALLKVDRLPKGVKSLRFEKKDLSEVGMWVAAVGPASPINSGVVSVKTRKLDRDQMIINNENSGAMGIEMDLNADPDAEGILIANVNDQGPAERAGLKAGDRIIAINNRKVTKREQLIEILSEFRQGDRVNVTYLRGETEKTVSLRLTSRAEILPKDARDPQQLMGGGLSGRRGGFPQVIQHDIVLSPKDCGGPLVDLDGRIIGLNIARAGRAESWALPTPLVRTTLDKLIAEYNSKK